MQTRYPLYEDSESLYISSFGLEKDGKLACYGPGRRSEGIIHYVLKGKGYFNGVPVGENQGFYIEPNSITVYGPDPEDPWNYFWMDCSPEFAQKYGKTAVKPDENGIFSYDFRGQLQPLIDKIISAAHTVSNLEALGYAFSVLAMHTTRQPPSGIDQHIRRAKGYIENNIGRPFTVRDVADAVGIHDRYLYNLFMKAERISPKEYILRRKLETAEDLLLHTDLPVSEIGLAAGFPDLYSFSRMFKRKCGMAPSVYRKSGTFQRYRG